MTSKKKEGSKRRIRGAIVTGAQLRAKRLSAKLTQAQLAGRAGYAPSYISDLECGRVRIGPRTWTSLNVAIQSAKL